VGVSHAGVAREEGPPDARGVHQDTFLVATTVGPTYWLAGRRHPVGSPYLRAGFGRAAAKRESTVRGLPVEDPLARDTGNALVLEGGYGFSLGDDLTFGLNVRWSRLGDLELGSLRRASFASVNLAAQWHLFPHRGAGR
jgi:hypothetical protein